MTRDDFEAITATPAVKYGDVKIEIYEHGFVLVARRPGRRVEQRISFAEAFEMKYPVKNFRVEIARLMVLANKQRAVRARRPRCKVEVRP